MSKQYRRSAEELRLAKTFIQQISQCKSWWPKKHTHFFVTNKIMHTWIILIPCHLLEAIVQRQVVSNWVLPSRLALFVKGKVFSDILVNLTQCQLLIRRVLNGHGNQGRVGIRWSDHLKKFLLAGYGQPSEVGPTETRGRRQVLPLICTISWRNVGRAVGAGQVGSGINARAVQPQVRVGWWRAILAKSIVCSVRRWPLRMVMKILLVHAEVVAIHSHIQEFLRAVVLNWTWLLIRWLLSKCVHNPLKSAARWQWYTRPKYKAQTVSSSCLLCPSHQLFQKTGNRS